MFELQHIHKSFGQSASGTATGIMAIRDLSLRIEPAKTTVIIGPSGCGKSTCLRLLIGLIRPDAGKVLFESQRVTPDNVREIRRRVGYVIQSGGLFPHLTVSDNITLMARELGHSEARVDQRMKMLVELTGFPGSALGRYPLALSGGQRQRVALMRALMLDPEALLLDEPLGALDPMIRYDLQTDLRNIFRQLGKTVVLVTHDLAEADYFADEIVLMRDGEIAQRGTLQEMMERPADGFVTSFITAQRGLSFAAASTPKHPDSHSRTPAG